MKTFSAMSQGDLRIIADALKEEIVRKTKIKLLSPVESQICSQLFLEHMDEMVEDIKKNLRRIERIGELLEAIYEVLDEPE